MNTQGTVRRRRGQQVHPTNSARQQRRTTASGPPGQRVPRASMTPWEVRLILTGVDPAFGQWLKPPHNTQLGRSPLTHSSPTQYRGCLLPCLTSQALQSGGDGTGWGWSDGQGHRRDGVLEGAVVPSLPPDASAQLTPSAPLPHPLSLLIQQKAFTVFSSAVEPEDLDLLHFKCLFVF